MSKTDKRITDACMKILNRKIDEIVPTSYAAAVVVLYEQYGWDQKMLIEFLTLLQEEWEKITESPEMPLEYCENRTGVVLFGSREPS